VEAILRIGFESRKGKTGVLLLHGLTGTPAEVKPLGDFLAHRGYSVLGPWLVGHGTHPRDLAPTTWQDWSLSAREALDVLKKRCTRVIVGGLSMGACLALHLASHEETDGVISMAGLVRLTDWRFNGIGYFRFLQTRTTELRGGLADPNGPIHPTYDYAPTKSLYELKKLMDHLRSDLPYVRVPALVVHGTKDPMVPVSNATFIQEALGSSLKHKLLIPDAGHVLPMDRNKEMLFAGVLKFLQTKGREIA